MRIHFIVSNEELPLYIELVKQLKSLGHNVTCGPDNQEHADVIICRGSTTPIPSSQIEKLTDTMARARKKLKLHEDEIVA